MIAPETDFGRGLLDGLRPPPRLLVSDWADQYRVLTTASAAEPDHYRTSRTPYVREIADALSVYNRAEIVAVMKGAQVGLTEVGNNWIGYMMHHAPGPALMVLPTVEMAKRNSKQRIATMINECEPLRERVADPKSKDSGNTILQKDFAGGTLVMAGANSAAGLRSMPVRYLFLDEVDGYPADVDGEGDPIELALKRTATFGHRRKVFIPSTPTRSGISRIEKAYEAGDQRKYHVPCPHCGVYQVITWAHIWWPEGEPRKAQMQCEACEQLIPESKKTQMLAVGEWRATAEGDGGRTISFHISALYSPLGWYSWADAAEDFLKAKRAGAEALRAWTNLCLGEPSDSTAARVEGQPLFDRREAYPAPVPSGALVLVAGADLQKDRLEMEVVGFGAGMESWSVDYVRIYGDPNFAPFWRDVDEALQAEYLHESGVRMRISVACIDAGYLTDKVVGFTRARRARRVFAIMGKEGAGRPVIYGTGHGKQRLKGKEDFIVGIDDVKRELYAQLALEEPGPGYCHFPRNDETHPLEYFRQLTGEVLDIRYRRGVPTEYWKKAHQRVEALDCRVYARAALAIRNPNWTALKKRIEGASSDKGPAPNDLRSVANLRRLRAQARRQREDW